MNWDEAKSKLTNLTENQAQFFKAIQGVGTASIEEVGFSGHGMGRVGSSLQKMGFIEQMGRNGRQHNWRVTDEWQKTWKKYGNEINSTLEMITEKK